MPDYPYPKDFQAVGSANPSGWWDAAGNEWFTAYGFYLVGGQHQDEGAHVFKRTGSVVEDVTLPEPPRPPQRGQLWPSLGGGLELRSHRSATVRCVIPIPGAVAPVAGLAGPVGPRGPAGAPGPPGPQGPAAPADPRLAGILNGLTMIWKAILGLK